MHPPERAQRSLKTRLHAFTAATLKTAGWLTDNPALISAVWQSGSVTHIQGFRGGSVGEQSVYDAGDAEDVG